MSVPLHASVYDDGHTKLMINISGDNNFGSIEARNFKLNLYAVSSSTGRPVMTLQLLLEDAARLYAQLDKVSLVRDPARSVTGRFVEIDPAKVTPETLKAIDQESDLLKAILGKNVEAVRRFVELELDDADCTGIAYRKRQLGVMDDLLRRPGFFASRKVSWGCKRDEDVWQRFFEANHWIFGYGLSYVVGDAFSKERLEQVTSGFAVDGPGKRADALLRTRGRIQALCFVEIKTANTNLLGKEYRPGCWPPSQELTEAIAQSHSTVQRSIETIGARLQELDEGFEVGHIYNVMPRGFLVVGSLDEMRNDAGQVHGRKFSSFELFRRQLVSPDIVTFDELHARAKMIVEAAAPQTT